MIKAKYVSRTMINSRGGNPEKDRWECPNCRNNPEQPECRFNLSQDKRNTIHKCRFCKEKILLKIGGE